jgi:hypothetical protein
MLPVRVLNTLMLGRPLAARIMDREPGSHAWIFVSSTIPDHQSWDEIRAAWTRTRLASPEYDPPRQFYIRYTSLNDIHLFAEEQGDLDLAMRTSPPTEDWVVVTSELAEVESVLASLLSDLENLRHPASVDYPEPPIDSATRKTVAEVIERLE